MCVCVRSLWISFTLRQYGNCVIISLRLVYDSHTRAHTRTKARESKRRDLFYKEILRLDGIKLVPGSNLRSILNSAQH